MDFHPAVLTPSTDKESRRTLELFARHARQNPSVMSLLNQKNQDKSKLETALVMIKPDNLARASSLPGHIIDLFGTTGMHIVGSRVLHLTPNDGFEFYGFLEEIFEKKLRNKVLKTMKNKLSDAFEFQITDDEIEALSEPLLYVFLLFSFVLFTVSDLFCLNFLKQKERQL